MSLKGSRHTIGWSHRHRPWVWGCPWHLCITRYPLHYHPQRAAGPVRADWKGGSVPGPLGHPVAIEMEHVRSNVHLDFVEWGLFRKLGCDFLSNGEMYVEKCTFPHCQKSDITQMCFRWYKSGSHANLKTSPCFNWFLRLQSAPCSFPH